MIVARPLDRSLALDGATLQPRARPPELPDGARSEWITVDARQHPYALVQDGPALAVKDLLATTTWPIAGEHETALLLPGFQGVVVLTEWDAPGDREPSASETLHWPMGRASVPLTGDDRISPRKSQLFWALWPFVVGEGRWSFVPPSAGPIEAVVAPQHLRASCSRFHWTKLREGVLLCQHGDDPVKPGMVLGVRRVTL